MKKIKKSVELLQHCLFVGRQESVDLRDCMGKFNCNSCELMSLFM